MKFTDNDNFKRVFSGQVVFFTAKELDQYMDCIEKDKIIFDNIRTISLRRPTSGFRVFPVVTGVDDIIEAIAISNKIDYGNHSGGSFMCLSLQIKEIVDAGGREAYITSKLDTPLAMGK